MQRDILMDNYTPASLPPITSVEIVALDEIDANRVDQYMRNAGDAPSITVDGPDAQRIADLWRSLPPGDQARCHIPPYGLRFRVNERVVCEASICWECDNIFGEANGRQFSYEFDAGHATSMMLLVELRRFSLA